MTYDADLAERNRLLQQDVIALRHALERVQTEKAAMRAERDQLFAQMNDIRIEHERRIQSLLRTIREWKQ
jgi:hypothetical protein